MAAMNGFDGEALRQRYLAERDKRMRADGEAQYIEPTGEFEEFIADPYVEQGLARSSVQSELDVLIVGGGFAGLLAGAELDRRDIKSFLIVEQAGDFGGTWYWNRYPGVRCDIEAAIYMPLIEEVGTVPTERYATGAEIFAHAQKMGRHFRLYDRALFQTRIETIDWDEKAGRWVATTDSGDVLKARFVCVGQGPLAKVKLPGIKGIRDFKGRMFHSARWDYAYTGGSPTTDMDQLADKDVAIIGTGATAVQIAPRLAKSVRKLYIFQRTPSAIDVRDNAPADEAWFSSQPPGWQRKRMENFLHVVSGKPVSENLVGDHWGDLFLRFGELMQEHFEPGGDVQPGDLMQQADFEKMEQIRSRVAADIDDPELVARLQPWYNFLCKRPLFSDEFLSIFNQDNVELVDTDGRGVERIDADGLVANGKHYAVDCIVLATGFDVGAPPHKVGNYKVTGRNGMTLDAKWQQGALRTLHGTQLSGFPNFHIVGGTSQGTTAFNFTHTLLMQAEHASEIIGHCLAAGVHSYEVTPRAEEQWHELLEQKHVDHRRFNEECTPGFLNNEGQLDGKPTYVGGTYGGGPLEYEAVIRSWRATRLQDDAQIKMGD